MTAALLSVVRRWRRNLLTTLAMLAGAAALVSILGISHSAAQKIAERVTAYDATTISVTLPSSSWSYSEESLQQRVRQLAGITGFGTLVLPDAGTQSVELATLHSDVTARAGVTVASVEGLRARGAEIVAGGLLGSAISVRDPYAVLLGRSLANELHLSTEDGSNTFLMNGQYATVVGIVQDGPEQSALSTGVVLSIESATSMDLLPPARSLVLQVAPGRADAVAAQTAAALFPENPDEVVLSVPPSPQQLRDQLLADTRGLVLVVTLVMIAATSFGIVNTMQISVWERRREIGLSRAIGMTSFSVARMFLLESLVLGGIGAILGSALGVIISASVARISGWTYTLPWEVVGIPLIGMVVGGIAGVVPATSAARVNPAELLRT